MRTTMAISLTDRLGFREGIGSVHTSRTMMLAELRLVLERVQGSQPLDAYRAAILEENVLGKATRSTRERSAERLVELYGLDPQLDVFRMFKTLWSTDAANQPMLAFLLATARDPLLRDANAFILKTRWEETVTFPAIAFHLQESHPGRFRSTTLESTARNLLSTWTQAGFLQGKTTRRRVQPIAGPVVATYALLLAHLQGVRGNLLLESPWARLLDRTTHDVMALAAEASKQGWLQFKSAGSVVEINFPNFFGQERIA